MESKNFREEFEEMMKSDSELLKFIKKIVVLNDSYAGLPNKNIPLDQIKIKGELTIKLMRMAVLCHKDADRIEDKVFQVFEQEGLWTSAEIFYEISTREIKLKF